MTRRGKAPTAGQLAKVLGVSTRRVQEMFAEGMPRTVAEAQQWHNARKRQRQEDRSGPLQRARERKTEAEAELAELELAKARGRLLPLEYVEERIARLVTAVRGRLDSFVPRVAPELVGLTTPAEVRAKLKPALHDLMEVLAFGDDNPSPADGGPRGGRRARARDTSAARAVGPAT